MLDWASHSDTTEISKTDFFAIIEEVHQQAFRSSTVLSRWRQTGLYPFKPELVINHLEALKGTNSLQEAAVPQPSTPTQVISEPGHSGWSTLLTIQTL